MSLSVSCVEKTFLATSSQEEKGNLKAAEGRLIDWNAFELCAVDIYDDASVERMHSVLSLINYYYYLLILLST